MHRFNHSLARKIGGTRIRNAIVLTTHTVGSGSTAAPLLRAFAFTGFAVGPPARATPMHGTRIPSGSAPGPSLSRLHVLSIQPTPTSTRSPWVAFTPLILRRVLAVGRRAPPSFGHLAQELGGHAAASRAAALHRPRRQGRRACKRHHATEASRVATSSHASDTPPLRHIGGARPIRSPVPDAVTREAAEALSSAPAPWGLTQLLLWR